MRVETREYKVYKFEELSDKAQEKALERVNDINIDNDWWYFCYEGFHENLKEIGLACESFYFSLDRDYYLEAVNLKFTDVSKFIHTLVDENTKKSVIDAAGLFFEKERYYHNRVTYKIYASGHIPEGCYRLNKYLDSLVERANDALNNKLSEFLDILKQEYEYLTSKEAIIETIEANEYEFLENGEIFI